MGRVFYFQDENGQPFAYVRRKILTLRENIRVYTDESMTVELLRINARNIIDFAAAFDVEDATTGEHVGTLKRRGFKSLIRDEWMLMDTAGNEIGRIVEDSTGWALFRRFILDWIPQNYIFQLYGELVGEARQNWNFFAPKMLVDFTGNPGKLDLRLGMAGVVLLMAVEGRQESESRSFNFGTSPSGNY